MKDKLIYWDIENWDIWDIAEILRSSARDWRDTPETMKNPMISNTAALHRPFLPCGFNVRDQDVFNPIVDRAPRASLCDLIYSLAHFDKGPFEIIDWNESGNPFESERFVGQFFGVDIRSAIGKRFGHEERTISISVNTPSNSQWNAFSCIDKMLDSCTKTPGGHLRQFLYLLSNFGWFSGENDFNVTALVKRMSGYWSSSYGGSYRDGSSYQSKEGGWDLEQVTVSVGDWQFIQYPSTIKSPDSGRMASLGYKDQIEIKKLGTKGMEQIHLYLNSDGVQPPAYIIHRKEGLEGLIGGDFWTEKELLLAEMMELRDEIFLDKPELFPILAEIQHLTPDRLKYLEVGYYPHRREEILNRFGEGTIKLPKMEK